MKGEVIILNIIVAVDEQNGIGKNNELLANIPEDMKHFREVTKDSIVIMGRKTFESLKVKPLPNRVNIVISRSFAHEGVLVCDSIESAIKKAKEISLAEDKNIFIIGGASVYEATLPLVDRLYITRIFNKFDADAFFPNFEDSFKHIESWANKDNLSSEYPHIFSIYEKK